METADSAPRRDESPAPGSGERVAVLFVCLGNICRSPAAEGVLQSLVARHALQDRVFVASAGTLDGQQGKRPDRRMRAAAAARGYDLSSRARRVQRADLETFDLVVAMDSENYSYLQALHSRPTAALHLFSEFLGAGWPTDVPDPYYGDQQGFELVLDMIEAGSPEILRRVRQRLQSGAGGPAD